MRIAFLTPEFVTEKKFDGGLANYLHRVTVALKKAGHDPEIFVATDRDEDIDFEGIRIHRSMTFRPRDQRIMRLFKRFFRTRWFRSWEVICVANALAKSLRLRHASDPFDVVQASDFLATGLRIPRDAGFPLITRLSYYSPLLREAYGYPPSIDRTLAEYLEERSIRHSHRVYCPSSSLAAEVAARLHIKVDTINPPVCIEIEPHLEDASLHERILDGAPSYVLFFGRICRPKGVYTLAEAMRGVLAERPHLRWVLAGREDPPGIVQELKDIVRDCAQQVIHLNSVPHTQLYPLIRNAVCVALPSRIDNFPNTCLEAMMLGQIVIGTHGTGFDDLITDNVDGFLVRRDAPAELEATVRRVIDLPADESARVRMAAKEKTKLFEPSRTLGQLLGYYEACMADYRERHEK